MVDDSKYIENRYQALDHSKSHPDRIPLPSKIRAKETIRLWNYDVHEVSTIRYNTSGIEEHPYLNTSYFRAREKLLQNKRAEWAASEERDWLKEEAEKNQKLEKETERKKKWLKKRNVKKYNWPKKKKEKNVENYKSVVRV